MDYKLPFYRVVLYSLSFTISYVGVLYLREKTRPSPTKCRDPEVIKARIISVSLLTLLLVAAVVPGIFLLENVYHTYYYAWQTLHIQPGLYQCIIDPIQCLAVTGVLFVGPLVKYIVFDNNMKWKNVWQDMHHGIRDIHGVRNFIIGPLTEELVFRACIIAVHLASNVSRFTLIYITPLYFGIAHLHHAYENYIHDMSLQVLVFTALFQFAYTTLFGWFASFIYLRTGSVWPPLAVHIFCNSMGLPEFTLDNSRNTAVYRILLVLGLVCFVLLTPLIDSPNRIL